MDYDDQRIDDAALALLALYADRHGHTWKGFDFGIMNRLHERGLITDPVNRNKGVYLTEDGERIGMQLAARWFARRPDGDDAE